MQKNMAESVNLAVFSEPTHREEYIKKHVGDKKVERYVATDGMTTKKVTKSVVHKGYLCGACVERLRNATALYKHKCPK